MSTFEGELYAETPQNLPFQGSFPKYLGVSQRKLQHETTELELIHKFITMDTRIFENR